jgi:hypothetical protein
MVVPGLYVVLAVVFGLLPWVFVRVRAWQLAAALVVPVVFDTVGLATGLNLYPWTDLAVAAIAAGGGILVGRAVSPRFRSMMLLLLVLAILDTAQIVAAAPSSAGHGQRAAGQYYVMFVVATSLANSAIGIFDLLVITAMAEHWRRRGAGPVIAVAPGLVGLLITYPAVAILPSTLPLIPFLFLGFVLTEGAATLWTRARRAP